MLPQLFYLGTKCTLKPALEKPQLLHLTRAYSYVGPAWYSREIQVPSDWKEKRLYPSSGTCVMGYTSMDRRAESRRS